MSAISKTNSPNLRTLEQRIANQEARIAAGVNAGTISGDEAKALRAKLEGLQKAIENDAYDGNGLTHGEQFAQQLNGTGQAIKKDGGDPSFNGAKLLQNIDARIKQGEADGTLTKGEAKALKEESKGLHEALKDAKGPFQKALVKYFIKDLSAKVHGQRHDGQMDSGERVKNFKERIAAGVKDGSLTCAEAEKLTEQVDALGDKPFDAKTANALSKGIYDARHNGTVDVPKMKANLKGIIDAGEKSGKLSPAQVSNLRAQLIDISRDGGGAQGARLNALLQEIRASIHAPRLRVEPQQAQG